MKYGSDHVDAVNPTEPLGAGSHPCSHPHAERTHHLRQRPPARIENHPQTEGDHPPTISLIHSGCALPGLAKFSRKPRARRRGFVKYSIGVAAVVTDSTASDQHPRRFRLASHPVHEVRRETRAAGNHFRFIVSAPTAIREGGSGEVHHSVDGRRNRAKGRRKIHPGPPRVLASSKHSNAVVPFKKLGNEQRTYKSRAAGNQNVHAAAPAIAARCLSAVVSDNRQPCKFVYAQ